MKLALSVGTGLAGSTYSAVRNAHKSGVSDEERDHVALLSITTLGLLAATLAWTWIADGDLDRETEVGRWQLNSEALPVFYLRTKNIRNQRASLLHFRYGEVAVNMFACTTSGNDSGSSEHSQMLGEICFRDSQTFVKF